MKPAVLLVLCLSLAACAHRSDTFQITTPEAGPAIRAPRAPQPVAFSDLLNRQYHLDFHEGCVDLTTRMAVRVQIAHGIQTDDVRYRVARTLNGLRLEAAGKPTLASARQIRFCYADKIINEPGQPYHPAFLVWGRTDQELRNRSATARHDPASICRASTGGCIAFEGKASVTPEILITAQTKPRYILLTATVQDLLRTEKIQSAPSTLRISRRSPNGAAPVQWEQPADALRMPLIAGDTISW